MFSQGSTKGCGMEIGTSSNLRGNPAEKCVKNHVFSRMIACFRVFSRNLHVFAQVLHVSAQMMHVFAQLLHLPRASAIEKNHALLKLGGPKSCVNIMRELTAWAAKINRIISCVAGRAHENVFS